MWINMNTLTFSKIILEKVNFSKELLEKEYRKFFKQLPDHEKVDLRKWYQVKFGQEVADC
jgi:hypothetical protein